MNINTLFSPVVLVVAAASLAGSAYAASYTFANEADPNIITHPSGYTGVGGQLNVNVCIVPGTPNAADMEVPVQNIVRTWNRQRPTTNNLQGGISGGQVDFESIALHELGHCIGLAHPNLATESGVAAADRDYTRSTNGADNLFNLNAGGDGARGSNDDLRGDDGNLHWYNSFLNDPFDPNLLPVIDSTTYRRTTDALPVGDEYVSNADRTVSALPRYNQPNTEAVMQQGSFAGELQRSLAADDVVGIRLAQSGLDEIQGGADDYTVNLVYQGQAVAPCDVNVSFDNAETGFAVCAVRGGVDRNISHAVIFEANTYFNTGFNWFYNTVSNAEANLSISQTDSVDPVTAGGSLTYSIVVDNAGPDAATDVVVTDSLPVGVTSLATTGCVEDPTGVPGCSLGSIVAGGSAQFSVTVNVDAGTVGTITNTVSVSSATTDIDGGDNNDEETTIVLAPLLPCELNASPLSLDFGLQTVGNSSSQTTVVSNSGQVDCLVTSQQIIGSADFSASPAAPFTVASGSSVNVAIGYLPSDAGADSATLSIAAVGSSVSVALAGNAAAICDVNGDGVIERGDIRLISQARNTNSSGPGDRRDQNGDGRITTSDGRKCARQCTNSRCRP